jgi:alkaline phosphatase D
MQLSRREFVASMSAALATSACGDLPRTLSRASADGQRLDPDAVPVAPDIPTQPFKLGVASGDPTPHSVILWTRLAPRPLAVLGGMTDPQVPLIWEVARTADFNDIVASDWLYTEEAFAHSAHVDVRGLEPDTWYAYRFRIGSQWSSPVGRTRTMPRHDASPNELSLVSASCQNFQDGYYPAHRHIAREDIDLVAFLGDYIYEYGRANNAIRKHAGPHLETLRNFRQRYGQYKSDPDLRAAHAHCPWLLTWDDHEVSNNYANLIGQFSDQPTEAFRKLRGRAYRAYYEHMPIRVPLPDDTTYLPIYRSYQFGDLANISLLDGRQYRSDQVCDDVACNPPDAVDDPERTMLGSEQHSWLVDQLRSSETLWNIIAQQTVFTPINFDQSVINPDQWDGYWAERQSLLETFGEDDVSNVTVLTGDIHTAGLTSLHADGDDETTPVVGSEIVATSISSGSNQLGESGGLARIIQNGHPYVQYMNSEKRGYCRVDYTRDSVDVRFRTVDTVEHRDADRDTDGSFTIDEGSLEITSD